MHRRRPQHVGYDPGKYANLRVSPDVQELFGYIQRYSPKDVEIPAPLKPFVPDYVPAVGDVDEFIKVPRPDGLDDGLGDPGVGRTGRDAERPVDARAQASTIDGR